ncbi:glycosyltransferase [Desulfocurvibacter africanus]|uniref:Glycosyl transferase family 2 n=1 Tax=Desulfocurvibacter africanus subsp. africanus str. Walvis Bay TaxID=690850 RepID=F3YY57_DESAF|nr:glycosyltransferase [Desulfocurvibacter africanus]EGJ51833.1 glycosyl transferase family 2 [Desulfocurvibacter africanus subsp. africanus str. Walvis Bay]
MIHVSLTSTSFRMPIVYYTLISLLRQRQVEYRLYLWLSQEPFALDKGVDAIPDEIAELQSDMFHVGFAPNTGSYRKLLPLLQIVSAPDDLIVIADDDVIYNRNWLDRLGNAAEARPRDIVCCRARQPRRNALGGLRPYKKWPYVNRELRDKRLLPIGVGGVAYRRGFFPDLSIFDGCNELAFCKDDLFLKFCTHAHIESVTRIANGESLFSIIETGETLFSLNKRSYPRFGKPDGLLAGLVRTKRSASVLRSLGLLTTENDKTNQVLADHFGFNPYQ